MSPSRRMVWGVVLGVLLLHAWYLEVVVEDAFITFRFARNLAEGRGLVWNPGEAPVEGYTSFLWMIVSACCQSLGLAAESASQVIGVGAALAAVGLSYRLGRDILGWSERRGWALAGLLSLSGPLAMWSASGMETTAFAALVLAAVYGFAHWMQTGRRASCRLTFAVLCLASLTRPEGLMLFGVLFGLGAVAGLLDPSRRLRDFLVDSSLFLVPFGVYFAWRYDLYGLPFPLTYYAKTGGGWMQHVRGLRYVGSFVGLYGLAFVPALAVSAYLWLPQARRPRGVEGQRATSRAGLPVSSWLAGPEAGASVVAFLVAVYSAYVVWVGGDYMPMFRFLVPILPLLYLLLVQVLGEAWARCRGSVARRGVLATTCALGIAGTLVHSTPLEARLFPRPDMMEGTYRGVQVQRWYVQRYKAVASALRARAEPADSLGLFSIGAIAYYTDLRVYGPFGLIDPEIALHGGSVRPLGAGYPGHEKLDLVRWAERRPTYLLFGYSLRDSALERAPRLPGSIAALIRREYRVISMWVDDPANQEAGYLTLFRRRAPDPGQARWIPCGGVRGERSRPARAAPEPRLRAARHRWRRPCSGPVG